MSTYIERIKTLRDLRKADQENRLISEEEKKDLYEKVLLTQCKKHNIPAYFLDLDDKEFNKQILRLEREVTIFK